MAAGSGLKIPVSVLVLMHTPDRQVLLLERRGAPDFWQSVTGSKEAGENLIDTAVREVAEETGLQTTTEALVDWRLSNRFEIFQRWRHRYPPGVHWNTEHVFSLCLPEPAAITLAENEHGAYRWLPWRAAAEACFSWTNRDAILMLGLGPGRSGAPGGIGDSSSR